MVSVDQSKRKTSKKGATAKKAGGRTSRVTKQPPRKPLLPKQYTTDSIGKFLKLNGENGAQSLANAFPGFDLEKRQRVLEALGKIADQDPEIASIFIPTLLREVQKIKELVSKQGFGSEKSLEQVPLLRPAFKFFAGTDIPVDFRAGVSTTLMDMLKVTVEKWPDHSACGDLMTAILRQGKEAQQLFAGEFEKALGDVFIWESALLQNFSRAIRSCQEDGVNLDGIIPSFARKIIDPAIARVNSPYDVRDFIEGLTPSKSLLENSNLVRVALEGMPGTDWTLAQGVVKRSGATGLEVIASYLADQRRRLSSTGEIVEKKDKNAIINMLRGVGYLCEPGKGVAVEPVYREVLYFLTEGMVPLSVKDSAVDSLNKILLETDPEDPAYRDFKHLAALAYRSCLEKVNRLIQNDAFFKDESRIATRVAYVDKLIRGLSTVGRYYPFFKDLSEAMSAFQKMQYGMVSGNFNGRARVPYLGAIAGQVELAVKILHEEPLG